MAAMAEAKRIFNDARKNALRALFHGTQLEWKSKTKETSDVVSSAQAAVAKIGAVPGVAVPRVDLQMPHISVPDLKKLLDLGWRFSLKDLVSLKLPDMPDIGIPSIDIPSIDLPNIDLPGIPPIDLPRIPRLIDLPNISLGEIPGFDLPNLKVLLHGLYADLDILPDINLRALVFRIFKIRGLSLPDIIVKLEIAFNLRIRGIPGFPTGWFDIEVPHVDLSLNIPDVNFPDIPPVRIPQINLPSIEIEGLDIPRLMRLPGFPRVMKLLFELFDECDIHIIIAELGMEALKEFLGAALPFVGQIKTGFAAASEWGACAQDLHKSSKVVKQKEFLLPGDPRAAADAVQRLLHDSAGQHAITAGIKTTQFAVSTAGLFADLGAASGPITAAAGATATLCQKVYVLSRGYKQKKAVNYLLSTTPEEKLCRNIFDVSPLLGAYFLTCSNTSDIINILTKDIQRNSAWMSDVEGMKRKIDPLLRTATTFIQSSSFELKPLRSSKGKYLPKTWIDDVKAKFRR